MLNKNKTDKGVTLMVLVITIAVLLILAGISITAITDDEGIWDKSNELAEASNTTIEKSMQELNNITNELKYIMKPWGQDETGENTAGGEDTQTTTGNWTQNKTTVTNGTTTYTVGDDYTYDCGVSGYTGGWKVLGAENGKLLIMSTIDVGKLGLYGISGDGTTSYPAGYTNGIDKLNEMCAPYGTNARSITVEDIDRVTGFDPTNLGNGMIYGAGNFSEYGNKVTYTASGSSATNGQTYTGSITYEHPDGRKIGTDNVTSITVESTHYYYYPNTLTEYNSGTTVGIATDSQAYKLLFRKVDDSANCSYWLASSYVDAYAAFSYFGMRCVKTGGAVNGYYLWDSSAKISGSTLGVRAVVSL